MNPNDGMVYLNSDQREYCKENGIEYNYGLEDPTHPGCGRACLPECTYVGVFGDNSDDDRDRLSDETSYLMRTVDDDNIPEPDEPDDRDITPYLVGAAAALAVAGLAYVGYKGVKALKRRHDKRKQLKLEQALEEQCVIDVDSYDDISNDEEDTDELQRSEEECTAEEER